MTLYAIIKAEKHKEKEPKPRVRFRFLLAEREGFEPPEAFTSTVFKTAAFDRSAISPKICSQKIFCYAKSFSVRFYFVVKWLNG